MMVWIEGEDEISSGSLKYLQSDTDIHRTCYEVFLGQSRCSLGDLD